ncbi:MAG: N-acetyltransferase [Bacteroidales bacterium]|nr:N-acetyltransferase [Bacteroidales bacterium]
MHNQELKAYQIVPLLPHHWNDVRLIYQKGMETGDATFETTLPDWESWDIMHLHCCRFIIYQKNSAAGWAALSQVSQRPIYQGVAEVSIYIHPEYQGMGLGNALFQHLITESEKNNIWTLQAGIFPENKASIKLHEKNGFRIVGIREKIGNMGNRWRDVVLMERRSKKVGL